MKKDFYKINGNGDKNMRHMGYYESMPQDTKIRDTWYITNQCHKTQKYETHGIIRINASRHKNISSYFTVLDEWVIWIKISW